MLHTINGTVELSIFGRKNAQNLYANAAHEAPIGARPSIVFRTEICAYLRLKVSPVARRLGGHIRLRIFAFFAVK